MSAYWRSRWHLFCCVYDGTKTIADQRWYITTPGQVWGALSESSYEKVQPTLESLSPWLWHPVADTVLNRAPAWLLLLAIGSLFVLLGRKKRPLIGYARD